MLISWEVTVVLATLVLLVQQGASLPDATMNNSITNSSRQLVARTAQDFADAVRSLQEGVDTAISIPAGVVLNLADPVTLKPLTVDKISTGSLTIRGGLGGTQPSVLHLGWRANVSVRRSSSNTCTPCKHMHGHDAAPSYAVVLPAPLMLCCAHAACPE